MQISAIYEIPKYSEPLHNCFQVHIQNPVVFTKIDKLYVTLKIQNPNILTILEYSEP